MTTITRRSFVVGITAVLGTSVLLLPVFLAPAAMSAARLGTYTCQVETVYGTDGLGLTWRGAKLFYDADAGTLRGILDPLRRRGEPALQISPSRLFSRLHVETMPSPVNNLTAVQYDRVGERGNIRPVVAWLMIETLGNQDRPGFQFFLNTIRVIVAGECVRGY